MRPMIAHKTQHSSMRRALVLVAALALVGCSGASEITGAISEPHDPGTALSPANLASLTDVVERNPADPQAYNIRGAVYGQAGQYEQALADFNKAIGLDARFAQAYANRGLVYQSTNKSDLALADYHKALNLDASYAAAYVGRGMVYRQKGQLLLALNDFNK